jgi:hypothetical protein
MDWNGSFDKKHFSSREKIAKNEHPLSNDDVWKELEMMSEDLSKDLLSHVNEKDKIMPPSINYVPPKTFTMMPYMYVGGILLIIILGILLLKKFLVI